MHLNAVLIGGPKAGRWATNNPPKKQWRFDKIEDGKLVGKSVYKLRNKDDNPLIYEYIGDE